MSLMDLSDEKLTDMFEDFLKSFVDGSGREKYREALSEMVVEGSKSLILDYGDLSSFDVDLAALLLKEPERVLPLFEEACYRCLKDVDQGYAEKVRKELRVRVKGLPEKIHLRELSTEHLNRLVNVVGMVVRVSELKPLLQLAVFRCRNGHKITVEQGEGFSLKKPLKCPVCNATKGFQLDVKESEFVDYQLIRIQELPEDVPPGQLPQAYDVDLYFDLVNTVRPGDRVSISAVVKAEPEMGKFRTFRVRLKANYIEVLGKEPERLKLSKEDIRRIKEFSKEKDAYEKLISSFAPAIQGYRTQKEALLLQIVGAPRTTLPDGTTIRGDINILLVGDPGTSKSEMLKAVARLAPRAIYTSGKGSTAAGITAAVVKEKSGMMMLEAGATVLADQGIACIDEFDKMRPEDRGALHEVMEQQTVSVAKGGIVATLNARTSILAAANPIFGKYDKFKNIYENVNLPIPLLTRFDLIFVLKDEPDRQRDELLAKHVLGLYRKKDFPQAPPLSPEFMKKYLSYCTKIEPKLSKEAEEKILEFYLQMRELGSRSESMITITPRQLETLVRLSMARARLLLKDTVSGEDAEVAISLMKRMFETVGIDVRTGKVDLGVLHGKPASEKSMLELAISVFRSLEGPKKNLVEGKKFVEELVKTGKFTRERARMMLYNLNRSGLIYEVKPGFYRWVQRG